MSQSILTVAVVGCGVIGMSWTTLFLAKGLRVIVSDPADGVQIMLEQYLEKSWHALKNAPPLQQVMAENLEFMVDILPKLSEVDYIQENGPENKVFKEELMAKLDKFARPEIVIASSSSGLPSSTFISKCIVNPNRILIAHPFNPPHLIPLVEVVPHAGTSPDIISTAVDFYKSLDKRPIVLCKEVPGFVANRLQAAINSEAYSLISRGVISAEDLDTAVTSGPGLRWGITGPIATNALGGGGGPSGFDARLERLGPAIKDWEEDMLKHRFDWSEARVSVLQAEARRHLQSVDWIKLLEERDEILLQLLTAKSTAMNQKQHPQHDPTST